MGPNIPDILRFDLDKDEIEARKRKEEELQRRKKKEEEYQEQKRQKRAMKEEEKEKANKISITGTRVSLSPMRTKNLIKSSRASACGTQAAR